MKALLPVLFALLLVLLPVAAPAQIPSTLSYQGVVTDSLGNPQPDGNYTFTFRLYTEGVGGSPFWTEVKDLDVVKGLFTTQLGDVTPFTGVAFDAPYWLGVKFGAAAEMAPRIPLNSVAYSLRSVKADTAQFALAAPFDISMVPVGTVEGFSTNPISNTSLAVWDSMQITIPGPGFLQTNTTLTVRLTDATSCPCNYRGYLQVAGGLYPTPYVGLITLDAVQQSGAIAFTGGINLASAGTYTINVVLYRSGGGGAAEAFGNGSMVWIPAVPTAAPAARPVIPGDENAAGER